MKWNKAPLAPRSSKCALLFFFPHGIPLHSDHPNQWHVFLARKQATTAWALLPKMLPFQKRSIGGLAHRNGGKLLHMLPSVLDLLCPNGWWTWSSFQHIGSVGSFEVRHLKGACRSKDTHNSQQWPNPKARTRAEPEAQQPTSLGITSKIFSWEMINLRILQSCKTTPTTLKVDEV